MIPWRCVLEGEETMFKHPFLLAVVLGIATYLSIAALKSLPFSACGDLTDLLATPGALLASVAYPQGIHSDHVRAGLPPSWRATWLSTFSSGSSACA
jgi:hypothetical protein